jgi:GT2 family glycosyltransferase
MDDDGRPYDDNCFSEMFELIDQKNFSSSDLYLLNSLVTYDGKGLSFGLGHVDTLDECAKKSSEGLYLGCVNPFNGTLLSNGLIKKIGFPNADFFIKGDEVDYLRRAKRDNAFVATIINSKYRHPKPQGMTQTKIFGNDRYIYIESPWKEYYNVRNQAYSFIALNQKTKALKFMINRILCCFVCRCPKFRTLKMILRGYQDAKKGRLGANVQPGA